MDKETRPVGKSTPLYGAITTITDPTNTHIIKDENDNDLVIEVFPIQIEESQLPIILQEDPNRWVIKYEKSIVEPTKQQIQQAIQSGQIIQISQSLRIIDNYGLSYRLTYNKDIGQYENKNKNIGQLSKLSTLPDAFIDYYQANDGVRAHDFPTTSRILYSILQEQLAKMDVTTVMDMIQRMSIALDKMMTNIESLNTNIQMLNDRITTLEGGR